MGIETEFTSQALIIRVPLEIAKQVSLTPDVAIDASVAGNAIVVQSRRYKRRKYSLEEMCAQVTDENRHEETDWGPAVGNEIWQ
jgi:antitoxin MazE